MASLQEEVRDVCKLADAVLDDPTTPISELKRNILTWAVIAGGPIFGPITRWLIKNEFEKIEREEKERMLREVICKQQAVIRRLNKELEENQRLHKQNKQEIKNLKEMNKMLEECIKKFKAA